VISQRVQSRSLFLNQHRHSSWPSEPRTVLFRLSNVILRTPPITARTTIFLLFCWENAAHDTFRAGGTYEDFI
jgi:hypothetical protein